MNFKKKRLNKALEEKIYRVKLVHGKKGWITVGLTFVTLFSATMFGAKTIDASAVNNVARANASNGGYVQLWNSVTKDSIHKANRGLQNGTDWKTAKAVKGVDGKTYVLVGGNEYADVNEMDLADETSSQKLSGTVHVGNVQYARLYTNPLDGAKLVQNRALQGSSDWKTNGKVTVDGETYYRVATNEWVKESDAKITSENSRSDKKYIKNAPDEETTTTITPDTNTNNSGSNSGSGSHSSGGSTTTPDTKTANVTVKYVNESGEEIATSKVLKNQEVGTDVTEKAIDVDGYTLTDEDSQKVTVSKDGNTITFTYKKTDTTPTTDEGKITVKYVDQNGDDVAPADTTSQKVGSSFLATARSVDGYTVQGDFTKTITVTKEDTTITFTYTKDTVPVETGDVTIKSVDENGDSIGTDTTVTRNVGDSYIAVAPQNEGYTLDDDNSKTVTVVKGENTVTFRFKKDTTTPTDPDADKTANVIVKYVDTDGNDLANSKTLTDQKVGSTVTENAVKVDGFTADKDSKDVVVNADGSTITFTYTKDAEPVQKSIITTKYVDADTGENIDDPSTETIDNGNSYTANAKSIDGYTLKGDTTQTIDSVSGDATLTFTYTKDAKPVQKFNITTKYVDEDGKEIADSSTETVDNGKSYTANSKTIDGYTIKGDSTKTIDSVSGNEILTFEYTKDEEPSQQGKYQYKISYLGLNGNYAGGESEDQYYELLAPKSGSTDETFNNLSKYVLDIPGYELYTERNDKDVLDNFVASPDAANNNYDLYYVSTKQPITVHYVDEDGNKIADDVSDSWYTDDERQVPYSKITGYYVKDVDKETHLKVKAGQNEITVHYTKNPVLSTDEIAGKLLKLVNNYRVSNSQDELTTDENLSLGAEVRATDEANAVNKSDDINSADHYNSDGTFFIQEPHIKKVSAMNKAENLLVTNGSDADTVAQNAFNQWKNSDEHNKNMLDSNMSLTGLSVVQLNNGQFLAIQVFAGSGRESLYDKNMDNTASIADLGYTSDDILTAAKNDPVDPTETHMVSVATLAESPNAYFGDRVFKSKKDYTKWNETKHNEGSIWDEGTGFGYFLAYDTKGNQIGFVPYVYGLSDTASNLLAQGKTTWTTDYVIPVGEPTTGTVTYKLIKDDRTGYINNAFLPMKELTGKSGDKITISAPDMPGYRVDEAYNKSNTQEITLDVNPLNNDYMFTYISNDAPIQPEG